MHHLTSALHCCVVAGTPVFLDETRGRYFLVAGEPGDELAGHLCADAGPALQRCLTALGLLDGASSCVPRATHPPEARHEEKGATTLSPILTIRAALMHRAARRFVGRSRFAQVTARMRELGRKKAVEAKVKRVVSLEEIAGAFAAARTLVGTDKQCVPLSLAIAGMMRSFGHSPTFVIGVQLPMAAHCWVQCRETVIGDTLERTRMFTPIFAA